MKKQPKITAEALLESSLKEQQFYRLKCEYLLSVLAEIETFTGALEKAVIKNAMERNQIDNLVHAKLIFNN